MLNASEIITYVIFIEREGTFIEFIPIATPEAIREIKFIITKMKKWLSGRSLEIASENKYARMFIPGIISKGAVK